MSMESRLKLSAISVALMTVLLWLSVTAVYAETYRWKDKDGRVHYGAVVPAEYANQPYDILNNAGMVIEHVEDTSMPEEIRAEKKVQERSPLISQEERERQADRLLVIQYRSEEEIINALELEIAQLGYDTRVINQSYESANLAIKDQIRQAADQQRANMPISEDQQKGIDKLYVRRAADERKRAAIQSRENKIRARYEKDLERYRYLTSTDEGDDAEAAEQK